MEGRQKRPAACSLRSLSETILSTLISKVQPVYLPKDMDLPLDIQLKNGKKFRELHKNRFKILTYINEDILLKNNETIIKKALNLLSLN